MLLAQIQQARTILEIGTLGGYSTIWLARALPSGGRLISLPITVFAGKGSACAPSQGAQAGQEGAQARRLIPGTRRSRARTSLGRVSRARLKSASAARSTRCRGSQPKGAAHSICSSSTLTSQGSSLACGKRVCRNNNVGYWHKAADPGCPRNCRYGGKSGHSAGWPRRAEFPSTS